MSQRQLSRAFSTECSLSEEIELLTAIYVDELNQSDGHSDDVLTCLELDLRPSTAQDVATQHVCLTLSVCVPKAYPKDIPTFYIKKPRGLSEAHIDSLLSELHERAAERTGSPMLFELIDLVKDHLTDNNRPFGSCPLCLYNFKDDDLFYRTDCYHYFHTKCITDYISFVDDELEVEPNVTCPVCRLSIDVDPSALSIHSDECEESTELCYVPDASMRAWQGRMATLYRKQMEHGGIIGMDTKKRAVLEISAVPSCAANTERIPSHTKTGTVEENPQVSHTDREKDDTHKKTAESDADVETKQKTVERREHLDHPSHGNTQRLGQNDKRWTSRTSTRSKKPASTTKVERQTLRTTCKNTTQYTKSRDRIPPGFSQTESVEKAPTCKDTIQYTKSRDRIPPGFLQTELVEKAPTCKDTTQYTKSRDHVPPGVLQTELVEKAPPLNTQSHDTTQYAKSRDRIPPGFLQTESVEKATDVVKFVPPPPGFPPIESNTKDECRRVARRQSDDKRWDGSSGSTTRRQHNGRTFRGEMYGRKYGRKPLKKSDTKN
ncbi:E3 ubiquitin-protein ligase RNF25-like [Corticium candelabrum]|uniref:E3 ubiquitin-protein ligase RNF25-like n=1 Tax=Corticium candelabrum TaxID=121492 RepID=UPI002E25BC6D|nr:E3 ubiquitin-protein ligase RNF25-like [Corticium candelabrum]